MSRPLLEPLQPGERLDETDMAARREAEFLADALEAQRIRAAGGLTVRKGVCANCEEPCMPQAVYCDADCRADHELRLARLAATGVHASSRDCP